MAQSTNDMLTVRDLSTNKENEMTRFAYDQIRFEKWDGKDRYKVTKGTPNKVAEKK
jgi:hypothetical protein